jgi:hypothetical protein
MFRNRTILVALAIIAPLIFVAGFALLNHLEGPAPKGGPPPPTNRVGEMLVTGFALSLVYLAYTIINWRELAIRAVLIDENYVALTGVSETFVEAFEAPVNPAPAGFVEEPGRHRTEERSEKTAREEFVEKRRKHRRGKGAVFLLLGVVSFLLPIAGIQFRALDNLGEMRPYFSGALVVVGLYLLTSPSEASPGSR